MLRCGKAVSAAAVVGSLLAGRPAFATCQPAEPSEAAFCITGVLIAGPNRSALLQRAGEDVTNRVRENDTIDGWTVARITPHEVELVQESRHVTLDLGAGVAKTENRPAPAKAGDSADGQSAGADGEKEGGFGSARRWVAPAAAGDAEVIRVPGHPEIPGIATHLPPVTDY